jgi:hypothetical protein
MVRQMQLRTRTPKKVLARSRAWSQLASRLGVMTVMQTAWMVMLGQRTTLHQLMQMHTLYKVREAH